MKKLMCTLSACAASLIFASCNAGQGSVSKSSSSDAASTVTTASEASTTQTNHSTSASASASQGKPYLPTGSDVPPLGEKVPAVNDFSIEQIEGGSSEKEAYSIRLSDEEVEQLRLFLSAEAKLCTMKQMHLLQEGERACEIFPIHSEGSVFTFASFEFNEQTPIMNPRITSIRALDLNTKMCRYIYAPPKAIYANCDLAWLGDHLLISGLNTENGAIEMLALQDHKMTRIFQSDAFQSGYSPPRLFKSQDKLYFTIPGVGGLSQLGLIALKQEALQASRVEDQAILPEGVSLKPNAIYCDESSLLLNGQLDGQPCLIWTDFTTSRLIPLPKEAVAFFISNQLAFVQYSDKTYQIFDFQGVCLVKEAKLSQGLLDIRNINNRLAFASSRQAIFPSSDKLYCYVEIDPVTFELMIKEIEELSVPLLYPYKLGQDKLLMAEFNWKEEDRKIHIIRVPDSE